jgi:hypothetical protein
VARHATASGAGFPRHILKIAHGATIERAEQFAFAYLQAAAHERVFFEQNNHGSEQRER